MRSISPLLRDDRIWCHLARNIYSPLMRDEIFSTSGDEAYLSHISNATQMVISTVRAQLECSFNSPSYIGCVGSGIGKVNILSRHVIDLAVWFRIKVFLSDIRINHYNRIMILVNNKWCLRHPLETWNHKIYSTVVFRSIRQSCITHPLPDAE